MQQAEQVALEVAESEFDRWVEAMDIDADESAMDEEDLSAFRRQRRRIVRAIQHGQITVNDEGEAVVTPVRSKDTEPVTFHQRTGATVMAADGKKRNDRAKQAYAMMADVAKCHPSRFATMQGGDIKICEAIFALLMD